MEFPRGIAVTPAVKGANRCVLIPMPQCNSTELEVRKVEILIHKYK